MAEKQSHLNGAYYGPAVPPPTQSYHRHGRGRGCGCCGCLFGFLWKLIVSLVIIIGLAVLIFWLIFRPNNIKFHVTDASLTQFDYSNNTLQYNLALNITARNPNKKIGVYYDSIEARAYFEDNRFDTVNLTAPFYQGHKNTSYLNAVFEGEQLVLLGTEELSQFNAQNTAGVYSIDVKLYLRIRFKVGKVKTRRLKPKVECDLKVPLSSIGNTAVGFEPIKCDVDF